ncbi:MAG TPA: lipase secretion chaperone [Spirochaetota bacterium]|nr:lipase secretion chaperone [Spirochaetota bacterium]HNT10558.1 lipase secretion chaperone [Spirochaetota bacterium]HNV47929.1 lipase secretion chaperone [Spirochaetota bacterium]HPU88869.1 lipase secretion chaperone [Spirochaetota bacterium]
MDKKKKIIIAAAGILIVVIILIQVLKKDDPMGAVNIIDGSQKIDAEDYKLFFKNIRFEDGPTDKYFSKSIANQFTIKFFKFLQRKFGKMSFEDHLKAVEDYLNSTMDPRRAAEMYALYKKFAQYERSLMDTSKKWPTPKSPEDMIKYLQDVQEYRRSFFGKELADELFGTMVKTQEYGIRKNAIVNDKNLYGEEKEKRLKELKSKMWGADASAIDSELRPYDQYQEKLSVYDRDLSELPEAERTNRIKEYRNQFFTPEVVARLEKVDEQLANEKQAEEEYRRREQRIIADPNLTPEQKDSQIMYLQNEMFGEEADAFRRREAIRQGLEEMKTP